MQETRGPTPAVNGVLSDGLAKTAHRTTTKTTTTDKGGNPNEPYVVLFGERGALVYGVLNSETHGG